MCKLLVPRKSRKSTRHSPFFGCDLRRAPSSAICGSVCFRSLKNPVLKKYDVLIRYLVQIKS